MYRVIADFQRIQPGNARVREFPDDRDNRWRRPPARAIHPAFMVAGAQRRRRDQYRRQSIMARL